MDELLGALADWFFDWLCYLLGRWTVIAVTFGRVRPRKTVRSVRWLSTLGFVEIVAVVLGGFVYWLYCA
ncbi:MULTISPECIES: hypothetical protein [Pseudomonas]|uniref:hypothetical protein n=1 Tax=Pseudomonas TaxID=286 RepID=UPI001112D615|nr:MULTISPECIES: hypothetical protein [Pseudomonas]